MPVPNQALLFAFVNSRAYERFYTAVFVVRHQYISCELGRYLQCDSPADSPILAASGWAKLRAVSTGGDITQMANFGELEQIDKDDIAQRATDPSASRPHFGWTSSGADAYRRPNGAYSGRRPEREGRLARPGRVQEGEKVQLIGRSPASTVWPHTRQLYPHLDALHPQYPTDFDPDLHKGSWSEVS